MTTEKPNFPEPDFLNISESLDLAPLGTALEERQRAKNWMEDAGRYARNEAYWREKRAYPAEECVRILSSMLNAAVGSVGAVNAGMDPRWLALINHVLSWGRPENPEQYHEIPTESAKIDDLKWLDNVVPRTANVSKPFAEQRFSVVQEFPGGKLGSVGPKPLMYQDIKDAVARFRKDEQSQFDPNQHIEHISPAEAAKQRILSRYGEFVDKARSLIQSWLDKQGHDKCWYYPEIFRELASLFGLKPSVDSELPSLVEFQAGCRRYQAENYPGEKVNETVVTDADVQTLIVAYKSLTVRTNSELWPKITALIDKMEAAIAENAKLPRPMENLDEMDVLKLCEYTLTGIEGRLHASACQLADKISGCIKDRQVLTIREAVRVTAVPPIPAEHQEFAESASVEAIVDAQLVSRERLDQLEHAEDNLRVLKEHETHSRSMSFAELLDVHQRGAASLQHIGYLFLAAMREDKCFTIKMGQSVEITETGEPALKIVQGANGDYFVQHKGGLWRIEANGVIGAGVDAWRSFCNVLAELGTPQGGAAAGNESGEPSLVVLDAARFQELNEAEDHLVALKAAGVDNWEGYVGPNGFKDE